MRKPAMKKTQSAEWLRKEAAETVADISWRIGDYDGPDWPLNEKQMRARVDSCLFDVLNKIRLYVDAKLDMKPDNEQIILQFKTVTEAITEAAIKAVEPEPVSS